MAHAGGSGDIAVIDISTDTVVTDIALGFYPWVMTMTPDGSAVFASGGVNERVGKARHQVISTASNSVIDVRFDVGYQGFAPDGTLRGLLVVSVLGLHVQRLLCERRKCAARLPALAGTGIQRPSVRCSSRDTHLYRRPKRGQGLSDCVQDLHVAGVDGPAYCE